MAHADYADLVDDITSDLVRDLCAFDQPMVSIYLPTHRANPDLSHDALTLRSLLANAGEGLADAGVGAADINRILDPLRELVDDRPFWARQGDGLALFADGLHQRILHLAAGPPPQWHVGGPAHLVPLLPLAGSADSCYVVALSLGRVRLFSATRSAITELDLGDIPGSRDEMERRNRRESELQHQHEPPQSGVATFHGHGGTEADDVVLSHFLLEVATGLRDRLGARNERPVVLAAVAEYLPLVADTGLVPGLAGDVIPGNHDVTPAQELWERAWDVVDRQTQDDGWAARAGQALGTGRAMREVADIVEAAEHGRVDTLLVAAGTPADGDLDTAICATLTRGGQARVAETLPEGAQALAMLRY